MIIRHTTPPLGVHEIFMSAINYLVGDGDDGVRVGTWEV